MTTPNPMAAARALADEILCKLNRSYNHEQDVEVIAQAIAAHTAQAVKDHCLIFHGTKCHL